MKAAVCIVPFALGLSLVAALQNLAGRAISATGVACSSRFATRLACAEMQERTAEASTELPVELYGCGAGASSQVAAERARTEALQRLAVQRWWYKGAGLQDAGISVLRYLQRIEQLFQRDTDRPVHMSEIRKGLR